MGPQETFIEQIQQHAGIIHKVISLYIDVAEDRKDLYQEVLLQAWKAYPRFRGDSQFSTWLYKITLNTTLTFRKKSERGGKPFDYKESDAITDNRLAKDNKDWLFQAIRKLPEAERMIITLHLEGYNNAEIAEVTGMSTNHINVKLHRIKKKLTQTLETVSL